MLQEANVKYDHVGSPRWMCQDFWGEETFDSFDTCQVACQALYRASRPRFLIVYPRPASEAPTGHKQDGAFKCV